MPTEKKTLFKYAVTFHQKSFSYTQTLPCRNNSQHTYIQSLKMETKRGLTTQKECNQIQILAISKYILHLSYPYSILDNHIFMHYKSRSEYDSCMNRVNLTYNTHSYKVYIYRLVKLWHMLKKDTLSSPCIFPNTLQTQPLSVLFSFLCLCAILPDQKHLD